MNLVASNVDFNTLVSSDPAAYAVDDPETLETLALEIESLSAQADFLIAQRLFRAREVYRYKRDEGGFTGWVEIRLSRILSVRQAYRLINAYECLGKCLPIWQRLPRAARHLLVAPATPETAVKEVISLIEAGKTPSFAEVKSSSVNRKNLRPRILNPRILNPRILKRTPRAPPIV